MAERKCGICALGYRGGKGGLVWTVKDGELARVRACGRCVKDAIKLALPGGGCIECDENAARLCLSCAVKHRERTKKGKRVKHAPQAKRPRVEPARRSALPGIRAWLDDDEDEEVPY